MQTLYTRINAYQQGNDDDTWKTKSTAVVRTAIVNVHYDTYHIASAGRTIVYGYI